MWKRDQRVREQQFCPGVIPTHQTGQRLIERLKWKENADHHNRTWPGVLNPSKED
jgi:hypothetical protein